MIKSYVKYKKDNNLSDTDPSVSPK